MSIAESYTNHLYLGHTATRYWVHPRVMVGGSIQDAADWQHLQSAYGCTHVVNAETEHSDQGKDIGNLCEAQVHDDGSPIPIDTFLKVIDFAKAAPADAIFYVHCQQGGSRSPSFAYCIMRSMLGMLPTEALAAIRDNRPEYGNHHYHQMYLACAETAIHKAG